MLTDQTIFTSRWQGSDIITLPQTDHPEPFIIGVSSVRSKASVLRAWTIALRYSVEGLLRVIWQEIRLEDFRWAVGFTDNPEHEAFFRLEENIHVYYLNPDHVSDRQSNRKIQKQLLWLAMHEVAHSRWRNHNERFIEGFHELGLRVDDAGYYADLNRRIGNTHIRVLRLFVENGGRLSLGSAAVAKAGLVQKISDGKMTTAGKWSPRVGELKAAGYLRTIGTNPYRHAAENLEITASGQEFLAKVSGEDSRLPH